MFSMCSPASSWTQVCHATTPSPRRRAPDGAAPSAVPGSAVAAKLRRSAQLRQRDYALQVLRRCRGVASFALLDLADRFDELSAADDARAHLERAAQRARVALAELCKTAEGPSYRPREQG